MSAFGRANNIEKTVKDRLLPRLQSRFDGVWDTNDWDSDFIQKTYGDYVVRAGDDYWSIELKSEAKWTGNLFLETWSNRSRSTPGWMKTCRADFLYYAFIDRWMLYVLKLSILQQWAFEDNRIDAYTEKPQGKYNQMNDTWGRPVPISVISQIPEIDFQQFTF